MSRIPVIQNKPGVTQGQLNEKERLDQESRIVDQFGLRQSIVNNLFQVDEFGVPNTKCAEYVAKTFPSILLDVARLLTEQATIGARECINDPTAVIRHQLKPFLMFSSLLGKCPQITGLMYSYFENSSFQPLPEKLIEDYESGKAIYNYPGFSDELMQAILMSYFRYLAFNPKWFSAVWNWGELGGFVTHHPNLNIRYLAGCCLSIITKPTRVQHLSIMREIIGNDEKRFEKQIELQIRFSFIYTNPFKPCIDTKQQQLAEQYARGFGAYNTTEYIYCSDSLTKLSNILLIKRDISQEKDYQAIQNSCAQLMSNYIPVPALDDSISRIAYAVSTGKPCLVRGSAGVGKTAILDYISAHTYRLNPPQYMKVQIGDQIDSKVLIGSYVCTEIPGQFEWQPGPLTKAMTYGSWIVFEDIDLAPADMAQVIHSVLENGNLSCVSSCPIKLDSPHPDFRIFFTQRTQKNKISDNFRMGFGFVERLCDIVDLPKLTNDDLEEVLNKRYGFGELSKTILLLFRKAEQCLEENSSTRSSRTITFRDLFKYSERIASRKLRHTDGKFSTSDLESIYLDAVDCFLLSLPKQELKVPAQKLGVIANLALNEVDRLVFGRQPEVREETDAFSVGRVRLDYVAKDPAFKSRSSLAYTKQSLQLLESISISIKNREPVLLVGETGVGKTSLVQHLANLMGVDLTVINLSQQSDSSDLLGGFKPIDMREIMAPTYDIFDSLFRETFDAGSNERFLKHVSRCFTEARKIQQWITYLGLVSRLCTKALGNKLEKDKLVQWKQLHDKVRRLIKRLKQENGTTSMALAFSEGSLLRAVREGKWILLDEINLAEPDVLQCLLLILDSMKSSHVYMHNLNNDDDAIKINPNFRIFACMNPSTDIGKRDLPIGTRGRFTEFFVDDVTEKNDLRLIVESYVKSCLTTTHIEKIVKFYQEVRARSNLLSDISGNIPVHSLRTLCRALSICSNNICRNMEKSLYESIKITFLQQLNEASVLQVKKLMEHTIFDKKAMESLEEAVIAMPKDDNHQYLQVEGFWIQKSNEEPYVDTKYITTKSVNRNLQSLARIISLSQRKLPILIQGNTSVGKTSLIMYLSKLTGNRCYRINNHEHTDLQEYVGRYVLKEDGELEWRDGLLVHAMKKGYWIILDELNLAPSELLEALNRVLDDNRELFIPERGEVVKAHSKFVLFATQNPPEDYAGRKLLSRAFRNRFIELHFDEIPSQELEVILEKRCEMPPQYAKKIVAVMKELQLFRRESGCFNGKSGFMTLRDLFRWGERYATFKKTVPDGEFMDWEEYLASEGLILLEGKVRTFTEADIVKKTIEKIFNRSLNRDHIYGQEVYEPSTFKSQFKHIHFSTEFQRLFVQLSNALKYKEPVLLCGQTGCGKTTACQLYASLNDHELITYNCHLNTESADFVGGVRPAREDDPLSSSTKQTFPWVDGPLVQAMKKGGVFLMDEISLSDDAVLERINSVLEPSRSITLTELDGNEIVANEGFRFVATMNPGGDYGKKELSPALRNRFTEIYCHNTTDINQIRKIIEACLSRSLLKPSVAPKILHVMQNFLQEYYKNHTCISIRDVLSWTHFLNKTVNLALPRPLTIQEAIINGASLVYFDQFGTCGHSSYDVTTDESNQSRLRKFLKSLVNDKFGKTPFKINEISNYKDSLCQHDVVKFKKFCLLKGPESIYEGTKKEFVLDVPIVKKNILKIVRAMQLDRPILLEGSPGAGKTSVVSALAKLTGHKLVRINLSEQTDISDLFGSDLPSESSDDEKPTFCWHDGPMLKAIKDSHWILLDEMNLASQSVLEGLNACFDHRGEIFISELNKRILVDRSKSRIFACQNPYNQGAARKGLPQSFLNRFTSIYIESHTSNDLTLIVQNLYPSLPVDIVDKMVDFNTQLSSLDLSSSFEFNLRDLLYWCELITEHVHGTAYKTLNLYRPDKFVQFVYLDRIRSTHHRQEICEIFELIFGYPVYEPPYREIRVGERSFMMTRSILPRKTRVAPHLSELCILKFQMPFIESIAKAIERNKMPILVGETGLGKRSMVRILAGLTGNELNIVGANRDMDTLELLGSYEQKNLQREVVDLVHSAKECVEYLINSSSQKHHADTWSQFFKHTWVALYATSFRDLKLCQTNMLEVYQFQLIQLKELIERLEPLNVYDNQKRLNMLKKRIKKLLHKFLNYNESMSSSGNFEWIDSILIKSIREGKWLMIENANLMNPATLDRLNSLVEPNGHISLNEKGSGENGIETIVPHPDFRLILTMNPEHGELSRAMRNRGVEIFIQSRFYFEDFLMLLNQNGFEPEEKKACMTYCIMQTSCDTHKKITGEGPEEDGSLLTYFGLNYITTLTNQVRRGVDVNSLLAELLVSFYSQRGYEKMIDREEIIEYVGTKMDEYCKTYEVKLIDERYKWRHLVHDLFSLSGGDAIPAMLDRDSRIFYEDLNIEALLQPDEIVDNIDIVNTCIQVKMFFELSTHGDIDYRQAVIKDTFRNFEKMLNIVDKHVNLLKTEYIPLMNALMPQSDITPVNDMQVDTRNTPDIHYYLQSIDYEGTLKREKLQNRWFLTLHRIMLRMIVEMVEDRSMETPNATSLWDQSELVRTNAMPKENLVRPCAGVASDLYDLLNGVMRVVSYRCFDDAMVSKMLPRFFWLSYFICKLKRFYSRDEAIAVCNQIPMLWALTCQKIIAPLDDDCGLADLVYKNKKFSSRIRSICEALDVTLAKPGPIERAYYKKVLNMYSATTKLCEIISREVDKFFGALIIRYTSKFQPFSLGNNNEDTLAASGYIWSNTTYMDAFYNLEDKLLVVETAGIVAHVTDIERLVYSEAEVILNTRKEEYNRHEKLLLLNESYKIRCLSDNRIRSALDQFAPIWQLDFLRTRLSKLSLDIDNPAGSSILLRTILRNINGLVLSPRYYACLIKLFQKLESRKQDSETSDFKSLKASREDADMYTAFLSDHMMENIILDHQVVGWTKLRVTTCSSHASAPLIPEYSPIISLVSGYCLDFPHLKLNSYLNSNNQLISLLSYLWKNYATIKLNTNKDVQDIDLVQNLLHLRVITDTKQELVGSYQCGGNDKCDCIEEYIRKRLSTFDETLKILDTKLLNEDRSVFIKSVKLIYFGYLNYLEYAPLFTLDPSLKSREKLEIYKAELAHIKLDLNLRNTLYYWKTGENLLLNEIDTDEAALYPFSTRILVERRVKLEKSIARLRKEQTNRPKTDDGSLYVDLRKDVEMNMVRYNNYIHTLMNELVAYIRSDKKSKAGKFRNLIIRCRMFIKNIEKTIIRFRSEYALYTDLTTSFLVGLNFVHQGLRCLYSRLEQKMQIVDYGFQDSTKLFTDYVRRIFSFNNFIQDDLESVRSKLEVFSRLEKVCPQESVSHVQSVLLRTILIQLNHHITITPSDIKKCMPIVRHIADLFQAAWLKRKIYFEEIRKQREELYQYRPSRSTLGTEITYERQEFLDLCTEFPTYDHIYREDINIDPTEAEKENLATEEKIITLNQNVDLTMCIDICKAHYKFIKEASHNLLGQGGLSRCHQAPTIDLSEKIQLEAQVLYTIFRNCVSSFDQTFDSYSIDCHLLQAEQLIKTLQDNRTNLPKTGSLRSSIEILDEKTFDIYHNSNPHEVLRFHDFIYKLNSKIAQLRSLEGKNYINHSTLIHITKLTTRISSFLISDPLMKFITGSHTLLSKIEEWNTQSIPKADKLIVEADDLIDLIKSWRNIEGDSWNSSLHRVKRKYIDNALCDLWFKLYEVFNNPIVWVRNFLREKTQDETFTLTPETECVLYEGFVLFIKEFFEDSTLGDYQLRLDLVFSFAIQTRFASLYEEAQPNYLKDVLDEEKSIKVDFEKLTTFVYNTYRQYQGLFEHIKDILEDEEKNLTKELRTEIRVVAWQGRNLWDIKNNFRISHKKLNKVMNRYLEVLRRPLPHLDPKVNLLDLVSKSPSPLGLESEKMSATLAGIQTLVASTESAKLKPNTSLKALISAPKVVEKLKELYNALYQPMSTRYIDNLNSIENALENNTQAIKNFYSHKVSEITIKPNDSKEIEEEKKKQCRQMYHSKKFAMQSIFKELQNLGISYQRGLNCIDTLDIQILSLEPLRGMIQNQSQLVLEAASRLVDEKTIMICNDEYRKLIASNLFLLAQPAGEGLDYDQMNRIRGCSLDMTLDIIRNNRSAAYIYRHLMDIQAATTRLTQLEKNSKEEYIVVFKFAKVHKAIGKFNDLVGRAYLAITKLERLAQCHTTASNAPHAQGELSNQDEKKTLDDLVNDVPEENSLMTKDQLEHFSSNLEVRETIAKISHKLRDMLNHTMRSHLYSKVDKKQLMTLYDDFSNSFSRLVNFQDKNTNNLKSGTVLGSLILIQDEIKLKLKPTLDAAFQFPAEQKPLDIKLHPNIKKLNIRLQRLVKSIKLTGQNVYKAETETSNATSKILNCVDSSSICKSLCLNQVSKYTGDCFVTLNHENSVVNIKSLVASLTPLLFIYTQTTACYLNIILASLRLKLASANQIIPFFTDLVLNGFGLPYKLSDDKGEGQMKPNSSEDNTGFGEGQGETDVSKKLEFESQLDDLKTPKDSENKDETQEEPIKAHDDGVEMSDDIDAKAEGAAEDDKRDNENKEDKEEQDEDNYDELDKELDQVDEEEERLDEKLWGDKDEPIDEDDEQDLREAEAETSSKPDGKPELEAKGENATDGNTEASEEAEALGEDGDKNNKDQINEVDENKTAEELNLEDEAALALKEAEEIDVENLNEGEEDNNMAKDDDTTEQIDMSFSDNDDVESVSPAEEDTTETKNDDGIDKEQDGEDAAQMAEPEPDDKIVDDDATSSSQNVIDDSEIDHQLEVAISQPLGDEDLPNPVEQTIQSFSAKGQEQGKESAQQEMKGTKIGNNTLYDILGEEENDPIDYDDLNVEQSADDQATPMEDDNQEQLNEQNKSGVGASTDDNQEKNEEKQVADKSNEDSDSSTKASKRTFAERPEEEKTSEIKRQKISEAADKAKDKNEGQQSKSKEVRHIEQDNSGFEVIDLVSSSDDEIFETPNESNVESGCKPRDSTEKQTKKKVAENGDSQDSDEEEDKVMEIDTQESKKEIDSPASVYDDPIEVCTSPITSIESGEIIDNSENDKEPSECELTNAQLTTTFNTNLGLLKFISLNEHQGLDKKEEEAKNCSLMEQIDNELDKKSMHQHESVNTDMLLGLWTECTMQTGHLVQELCQQLQIVLQPTKMSKYKGDYKSGKRLNMRKIISYIASHYRRDKIWLRRTKPSKRTYNITIAVDNSSSMNENNCRQMTYQSLALLAKSLSLIEAGSLSVVSFGEQVNCVHAFGEPYFEAVGAQWLRALRFNEKRTSYKQLLASSCDSFAKQAQATASAQGANSISQLLIIISDGRNVTSEEEEVKSQLRQLKSMGVLTLFIIIDDLRRNAGCSIVDVKRTLGLGINIQMVNYMELFPFPFYVLLRRLDTMPSVLGDALRQWFELVSNS